MAAFQLRGGYPPGTTVSAFLRELVAPVALPPGAPPGTPDATAVTAASGTTLLTGLVARARYVAYGLVNGQHRYIQFTAAGDEAASEWTYESGISGSVAIPQNASVISCAAHSATGGSVAIDAGDVLPLPAGLAVEIEPVRLSGAATVIFDGTDAYALDYLP